MDMVEPLNRELPGYNSCLTISFDSLSEDLIDRDGNLHCGSTSVVTHA